ncbi:MAG: lipase family protein [Campylobacterota bacterium]|nr:lipase family protein [Campylobacterota bacterium]
MLKKSIFVVILSLFLVGCGSSEVDDSNKYLVSSELLVEVDAATLRAGLPQEQAAMIQFGYKAYKIIYNTTYKGENIEASGVLVLPTEYQDVEGFSLSMVCDAHGTVFADSEVPSTNYLPNLNPTAVGFSSMGGFVTIQPDYIGFGKSGNKMHSYMLKDPLADSSIDMIQAVIEFARGSYLPINGQLFLSGYSEGGYATMATLKELEESYSDSIKVVAAAPMAAPYNMDLMAQGVLSSETMVYSPFMGFVAASYANYYDDITLDQLISSTYATQMPALFDGSFTGDEIYMQLTNYTQELFTLTQISDYFSNPNDSFKVAMVENSIHNWTPKTKMRLYHCDQDPVIPHLFSQEAYGNFVANGSSDVELITLEGNDHAHCATIAYPQVIAWFDQVRKGE